MPDGKIGSRRRERGFTLIELMVVVAIIGILAAMAAISVVRVLRQSKENVLRHDLKVMRDVIQQYKVDKKRFPPSGDALVNPPIPDSLGGSSTASAGSGSGSGPGSGGGPGYLRAIPVDPITGKSDTWIWVPNEPEDPDDPNADTGIKDVKSGAAGSTIEGVAYADL